VLEFKKSVLKFTLDGKEYEVKFPTIKAVQAFQAKAKEKAEDDLGLTIEFLSSLGLDKEVCETLEITHLTAILTALTDSKKN
jgi:hypothetical protein